MQVIATNQLSNMIILTMLRTSVKRDGDCDDHMWTLKGVETVVATQPHAVGTGFEHDRVP